MGVTSSDKQLNATRIDCGDSFKVTLSLSAEPNIVSNPTDIVMLLDRSGSMSGNALASLKTAAKKFIDIIDEATDSAKDGNIGCGSRIGIVSFADTAAQNTSLITSVQELDAAVDSLSAGGFTNHADAFKKAAALFEPASTNAKVYVMFTDGKTTAGEDPDPLADAAKASGVVIYCIGLSGNGGIDESALDAWASDPDSAYVAITPDDKDLEKIFSDLAENIAKPGATGIQIEETVSPCFVIEDITKPDKGAASLVSPTSLSWKIDKLGVSKSEGAALVFTVRHVGPCKGTVKVNESLVYSDNEGNKANFPSPEINVVCDTVVIPEPCPPAVDVAVSGCSDSVEIDAGELTLGSLGRIVRVDVKLKNVCPKKRVALAVVIGEVDEHGIEYRRGMKTLTILAHDYTSCRDITVKCITFVLPEDIRASGTAGLICGERDIRVRTTANYIDDDFTCCGSVN